MTKSVRKILSQENMINKILSREKMMKHDKSKTLFLVGKNPADRELGLISVNQIKYEWKMH